MAWSTSVLLGDIYCICSSVLWRHSRRPQRSDYCHHIFSDQTSSVSNTQIRLCIDIFSWFWLYRRPSSFDNFLSWPNLPCCYMYIVDIIEMYSFFDDYRENYIRWTFILVELCDMYKALETEYTCLHTLGYTPFILDLSYWECGIAGSGGGQSQRSETRWYWAYRWTAKSAWYVLRCFFHMLTA